jgi:sugar phosphate isomerase/epimerase
MRLSFSTAGLYPIDTIEALKLVSQSGFEEAELMPQCYREITDVFAFQTHKQLKESGCRIKVSSIHFPLVLFASFYNLYGGMRKETEGLCEHIVASAVIYGTEIIVIHAPNKMSQEEVHTYGEAVYENIRYLCDTASDFGITIALENNPKTVTDTPEHLRETAAFLNRGNLKPMLDTTEASEASIQPIEFVKKIPLCHLHLSDHAGNTKHIIPGMGEQNWQEFFELTKEKNYTGIYVAEPSYRFMCESPKESLLQVRRFFDRYEG